MKYRRIVGIAVSTGWVAGLGVVVWAGCSSPDREKVFDAGTAGGGDATLNRDAPSAPEVPTDGGVTREGGCAEVKGPCDLVLQDCADDATGVKRECVVRSAGGAGVALTTECVPVQPSQQLPLGRGCCPGAENPCLPGLSCVGAPCVDGGAVTGRCSPACCEGDHVSCGQSNPEGIGGQCDVTLFLESTPVHHVCSYRERCKPFGVEPCKAGKVCILEDRQGTAGCITSAGLGLREPCNFANDCADGLLCTGEQGSTTCRMMCLTPNSNPPFDASAATGAPGLGGCASGEACTGPHITNLPDWLQLCALPDGG